MTRSHEAGRITHLCSVVGLLSIEGLVVPEHNQPTVVSDQELQVTANQVLHNVVTIYSQSTHNQPTTHSQPACKPLATPSQPAYNPPAHNPFTTRSQPAHDTLKTGHPWCYLVGAGRTSCEFPQKRGYFPHNRISTVRESYQNAGSRVSTVLIVTILLPMPNFDVSVLCSSNIKAHIRIKFGLTNCRRKYWHLENVNGRI